LPSQGRLRTRQPASHNSQKTSWLVNGRCAIVYYSRSFLWIGARKSHPQFHHPHRFLASSHVAALLYPQRAWAAGGSSQTLAYKDHDLQRWDVDEIHRLSATGCDGIKATPPQEFCIYGGHAAAQLVEALRWCHWNFSLT